MAKTNIVALGSASGNIWSAWHKSNDIYTGGQTTIPTQIGPNTGPFVSVYRVQIIYAHADGRYHLREEVFTPDGGDINISIADNTWSHVYIRVSSASPLPTAVDILSNTQFSPVSADNVPNWFPENQLSSITPLHPEDTPKPEHIEEKKEDKEFSLTQGTPLVLDLDGDGIELASVMGEGSVYWDIDEDGFAEASGWTGPDDGLLAIDINNDGIINDHGELFGTHTIDGFTILSSYDSNLDGIIDSGDAAFSQLLVWQDINGDGYSQEDELHTLTELNITSISLAASQVSYTLEGNTITHESTFVMNGQTRDIVDAWFTYDNINTIYSTDYNLDERVLYMPTLRGYGDLPALYIAMSLDNGTGGLLESVLDFTTSYGTGFGEYEAIRSDVRDILFQWADVTTVDPDSRGPNVDARELAFLEKLTGSPFLRGGYDPNPLARAGETLTRAFSDALTALTARLLMQTEAASIFEGDNLYNPITDTFTGALTLDETALAALEPPVGDELSFWQNVVAFVIGVKGEVNLTVDDIDALDDAITASAPLLDFETVYDSLYDNPAQGSEINGNNAVNDTLNGTVLNDEISGLSGNDTLNGGQGNDGLYGGDGNDTLTGGTGDDLLEGGDGNDIYVYNLGDGIDTIRENKESEVNDTIQFGAGITISDLTFVRLSNNDMEISINVVGYEGKIRIENQFVA